MNTRLLIAVAAASTAGWASAQCTPPETLGGPDLIIGDIPAAMANYTGQDGIDAFSFGRVNCNIGNEWLNWIASTNQHPVFGQALYKLRRMPDGSTRFEQLGQSWLAHAFFSLSQTFCCSDCIPTDGTHLGVHCSEPNTASRAGSQSTLSPRWQVNAATGVFAYPPVNPPWSGSIARRLQVHVEDLEPSSADVLYYAEIQAIAAPDEPRSNRTNNWSYRQVMMAGSGAAWTAGVTGTTQRTKQAIWAWQANAAGVEVREIHVPDDGLILVGAQAVEIGGGRWHYEYVVQNMNSDRSVQAVAFACPALVDVSNVEFNDVDYHSGDGPGNVNFSGVDWTNSRGNGVIRWETEPFSTNQSANAIRWGTMYTFRFDADMPPTPGDVTLTLFKPGTPVSMTVTGIPTPSAPPARPGDLDGDGDVDISDLALLLASFGFCAGDPAYNPAADLDDTGCVDISDLSELLAHFGTAP